jgi:hypothetical protein
VHACRRRHVKRPRPTDAGRCNTKLEYSKHAPTMDPPAHTPGAYILAKSVGLYFEQCHSLHHNRVNDRSSLCTVLCDVNRLSTVCGLQDAPALTPDSAWKKKSYDVCPLYQPRCALRLSRQLQKPNVRRVV